MAVYIYKDGTHRNQINKELAIWRKLRHPNICKLIARIENPHPVQEEAPTTSLPLPSLLKKTPAIKKASYTDVAYSRYFPNCSNLDDSLDALYQAIVSDEEEAGKDNDIFNLELKAFLDQQQERKPFIRITTQPTFTHGAMCELFNGDLHNTIFLSNSEGMRPIPLEQRLSMMIDLLSALRHLHQQTPPILMMNLTLTKCYTYQAPRSGDAPDSQDLIWRLKLGGFFESVEVSPATKTTIHHDIYSLASILRFVLLSSHDPALATVNTAIKDLVARLTSMTITTRLTTSDVLSALKKVLGHIQSQSKEVLSLT